MRTVQNPTPIIAAVKKEGTIIELDLQCCNGRPLTPQDGHAEEVPSTPSTARRSLSLTSRAIGSMVGLPTTDSILAASTAPTETCPSP